MEIRANPKSLVFVSSVQKELKMHEHIIEVHSSFESRKIKRFRWQDLDQSLVRNLIAAAEVRDAGAISEVELLTGAVARGLVWLDTSCGEHYATAAGIVLLSKDPSAVFPQCRIVADAYQGTEPDSTPLDHEDIRAPAPLAIERAMAFIDRNTRHPTRIVGPDRVTLNEYPAAALREALVNATIHRQYEDTDGTIMLKVFFDRVSVLSPGMPPAPLTLASLRRGKYRPCSRNPVLARCLSYFYRVEERGGGLRRMRDEMLNHGLKQPVLGTDAGYLQVTFPGLGTIASVYGRRRHFRR